MKTNTSDVAASTNSSSAVETGAQVPVVVPPSAPVIAQAAVPPRVPVNQTQQFIVSIIVMLSSGIAAYLLLKSSLDADTKFILFIISAITFVISTLAVLITLLKAAAKPVGTFAKNKPIIFWPIVVSVILVSFGGWQLSRLGQFHRAIDDVELGQDLLARGMYIKEMGNRIQAGRSVPGDWTMAKVMTEADALYADYQKVTYSSTVSSYYEYSIEWVIEIAYSAEYTETWTELSDAPENFDITLSDAQLQEALQNSVNRTVPLQEFGDTAIVDGDFATMQYIEADLWAESYLMEGYVNADEPTIFSGNDVGDTREVCINVGALCLTDAQGMIGNVWRSSYGYTVSEPDAPERWNTAWDDAAPMIDAENATPLGGAGITIGEPVVGAEYSPTVQAFMDSCTADGGTLNGSGGIKTRLPTTESGYTCWEPQSNGNCWAFLTYSGGYYSGGDAGVNCPEEGLVPESPAAIPTFFNDIEDNFDNMLDAIDFDGGDNWFTPSSSYDGVYSVNVNGGSCNVPGISASTFSPYASQIEVNNNAVANPNGGSIPIDSSGVATISFSFSESGVYGTYTDRMVFSQTGSGATVSGQFTFNGGGSNYGASVSVNCTASYTGTRGSP